MATIPSLPASAPAIRFLQSLPVGVCTGRVVLSPVVARYPGAQGPVWRVTMKAPTGTPVIAYAISDPEPSGRPSLVRQGTLVTRGTGGVPGLYPIVTVAPLPVTDISDTFIARGAGAALAFRPSRQGGLPSAIRFGDDPELTSFAWNDRVHHPERGGWMLRNDRSPRVQVLAQEPNLTVVRVTARYCREDGAPEPGGASAVYDWYVFPSANEVFCQAFVAQPQARHWAELHHLEFNSSDAAFTRWAGGDPPAQGSFGATRKGWVTSRWGSVISGRNCLGILAPEVRFYDGRGEYGTYIHGAWESWSSEDRRLSAWLWIGAAVDAADAVARTARMDRTTRAVVTTVPLDRRIVQLSASGRPRRARWMASIADRLRQSGDLSGARRIVGTSGTLPDGPPPSGWLIRAGGEAGLALHASEHGVRVTSLFDLKLGRELAAPTQPPLFRISLRRLPSASAAESNRSEDSAELRADAGWKTVSVKDGAAGVLLRFADPTDARLSGISVTVKATPDPAASAWHWHIAVANRSSAWSLLRVAFPQIGVEPPGTDAVALYPTGPGVLHPLAAGAPLSRNSLYPNGWCTMQMMAVYGPKSGTGLYYALHDPLASAKNIVQTREPDGAVTMAFDVPAPMMGRPGTGFSLTGVAVWRLLRGDWFDAARMYRSWVVKEARWYPKLGADGRADTPVWAKRLCAWAQTGGSPAECVEAVKSMQRALGVPIGFHWYNWHRIPFDNDYPHYFPTKPGVTEAVADLQARDVYVMPYINGRLWDTRDRGVEDAEFSSRALPSATKDEAGQPYIETYGSKEADGSPVRLAVMCPVTPLWQRTVRETVLRLMTEVGTKGVYIDQIAAAAPALCMDASHRHALGGGSWWTEQGYWPLLRALRERMPDDRMITTECAAEPYANCIDAYLTWDWQAQGMVPALPAIYGGAVQYFGRNYSAGAGTRDLALCMKMGQQLVFGEQIGWLDPRIAAETIAGTFLKLVVRTRSRHVAYWSRGEMARPPRLAGDVPAVRADWAWYGETWVSTPAVMTGAWKLAAERRLLLLFVNVGNGAVRTAFDWDARTYGVAAAKLRLTVMRDPDAAAGRVESLPVRTRRVLALPARSLQVWEVRW